MLVLTRHRGETVICDGPWGKVLVHVCEVQGNKVRLGFSAPAEVRFLRPEHMSGAERDQITKQLYTHGRDGRDDAVANRP